MKKQLAVILMIIAFPAICIVACQRKTYKILFRFPATPLGCSITGISFRFWKGIVTAVMESEIQQEAEAYFWKDMNNIKSYAQDGTVYGYVAHLPGYVGMPYETQMLDECTINKILDWTLQGSPNN